MTIEKNHTSQIAPASVPARFKNENLKANGVNIHYVVGGEGEPLVLLHGFAENWYVWNRLLPELSKHFTIIAPDMRGIGESDKPATGYDKKTMAADIHEMVKKLGYKNIKLVGHDIGLMVAYAYAAQYPNEVKKVALMDAMLPGIEPVWTRVTTASWHISFFEQSISAILMKGHEKEFLNDFWPQHLGKNKNAFYKAETDEFIRSYSVEGAIAGSLKWYKAFQLDVADNHEFMKQKLKMPFLAMGGEYSTAPFLANHVRLIATNVSEAIITDAGHWLVQEQPNQVLKGLTDFFSDK